MLKNYFCLITFSGFLIRSSFDQSLFKVEMKWYRLPVYNQSLRWKEVTKIFQISDVTTMAELVPVTNTAAFEVIFQNNVNCVGRTLTEKVIAVLGLARFTIFFVLKFLFQVCFDN